MDTVRVWGDCADQGKVTLLLPDVLSAGCRCRERVAEPSIILDGGRKEACGVVPVVWVEVVKGRAAAATVISSEVLL